jgi:hypothetical protein
MPNQTALDLIEESPRFDVLAALAALAGDDWRQVLQLFVTVFSQRDQPRERLTAARLQLLHAARGELTRLSTAASDAIEHTRASAARLGASLGADALDGIPTTRRR